MGSIEYRVEHVHFSNDPHGRSMDEQLVEQFNAWAREGWRVANVDLSPRPTYGPPSRTVLLERDRAMAAGASSEPAAAA